MPTASDMQAKALDARVPLQPSSIQIENPPEPAIRPYPLQYVAPYVLKNGTKIKIRPIRPDDEPLMAKMHRLLSDRSVYLRYFASLSLSRRVSHERLFRICSADYDREIALVAEQVESVGNGWPGERKIIGVGRLSKLPHGNEGEVAVLVIDECQKQGLGAELLRRIVQVSRDEKLNRIFAEMLTDNTAMQIVVRRQGFKIRSGGDSCSLRANLDL